MNHVNFLFLGVGNGAVFAALALALVVTYRSSGVLNFATGAIALYGAYTFAFLREGSLLLLAPGLPRRYHLDGPMPFVPAVVVTVAMSALLGVLMYVVVFRPLRSAVPVAKAVASIGVMVVMTGLVSLAVGSDKVGVKPIFPVRVYTLGELRLNGDRLWFAVVIVGVGLALGAFYRFTRFGLATRAASESEFGAFVTGLKPGRIAVVNWAISAGLCGLAGILIAPLTPLTPGTYTLFVVPALAAAVLGRFHALGPAVFGGLVIGMLQSEAVYIRSSWSWTLSTGNAELVPLAIVLVVLLVNGRPLPTRGTQVVQTLGRSPRPQNLLLPILVLVPVAVVALAATQGTTRAAIILSMILAIISLSLVVVTGYAGQLSLAQLTLAGVGGFLLSRLTTDAGIPFPIAPLLAASGAAVFGVVFALPALRIRGLLVGIVTLMLAVTVEAVWFRNVDLNGGGARGAPIGTPRLFGMDLGIGSGLAYPRMAFGLMVLVVLVIVTTAIAVLRRSRMGAAMLAVRANERSAAAAGISVLRVKVIAFAIGAFVAGIGGSLLAYRQGAITFSSYSALAGLAVLSVTYVGGITSIRGGILAGCLAEGGIAFVVIDRNLELGQWFGVVTGGMVIFTVLRNPEGISGTIQSLLDRRRSGANARASGRLSLDGRDLGSAVECPVPEAGDVILDVRDLTVVYGGVAAVSGLSFSVRESQIVGLIGPNGAGKTTTMDVLSGFVSYSGRVTLAGRDLDELAPHRRAAAGLGRTFQGLDLYEDLSVGENIAVGLVRRDKAGAADALDRIVELLGLGSLRGRTVSELSQGERQLVSIARSLATEPKVLLLDEPAAGLDAAESVWLADRLRQIRNDRVTIVLVDHDMSFVLGLCDEIHVLDFGRLISSGTPAQTRSSPVVTEAYLGSAHAAVAEVVA